MTQVDFTYCPCPIVCGQKATFTSTVTGDPVSPVYSWDFGDCSKKSTDANPCHVFKCPGTYTVKVTVTPDGGTAATYSKCVVVVASFWSSFLTILLFVIIVALIVAVVWYFFFRESSSPVCKPEPECKPDPCSSRRRRSSS